MSTDGNAEKEPSQPQPLAPRPTTTARRNSPGPVDNPNPPSLLFRGQRIRRRSFTGRGRGGGSLEVHNRQNWLNIDQVRWQRQVVAQHHSGSSIESWSTNGMRHYRGFIHRGFRSALGVESHRHVGRVLAVEADQITPDSSQRRQDVNRGGSVGFSSNGPNGVGRAVPLMSMPGLESMADRSGPKKPYVPAVPLPPHIIEQFYTSGLTIPDTLRSPCEIPLERQNVIKSYAHKKAEQSFGWFKPTDSLYNPIMPVLPQIILTQEEDNKETCTSTGFMEVKEDEGIEGKDETPVKCNIHVANPIPYWMSESSKMTERKPTTNKAKNINIVDDDVVHFDTPMRKLPNEIIADSITVSTLRPPPRRNKNTILIKSNLPVAKPNPHKSIATATGNRLSGKQFTTEEKLKKNSMGAIPFLATEKCFTQTSNNRETSHNPPVKIRLPVPDLKPIPNSTSVATTGTKFTTKAKNNKNIEQCVPQSSCSTANPLKGHSHNTPVNWNIATGNKKTVAKSKPTTKAKMNMNSVGTTMQHNQSTSMKDEK